MDLQLTYVRKRFFPQVSAKVVNTSTSFNYLCLAILFNIKSELSVAVVTSPSELRLISAELAGSLFMTKLVTLPEQRLLIRFWSAGHF